MHGRTRRASKPGYRKPFDVPKDTCFSHCLLRRSLLHRSRT
ncbi:unnamed protein product [Arabidopsis lyrata]|nr:unnamed protein product [Arabidopsis lyrata]